jgi:proline-specific peptidase
MRHVTQNTEVLPCLHRLFSIFTTLKNSGIVMMTKIKTLVVLCAWSLSSLAAVEAFAPAGTKIGSCSYLRAAARIEFDESIDVNRTYSFIDDQGLGDVSTRTSSTHQIKYHIRNKMNLSSQQAAPILVLHGGPGIPSDYLLQLKDVVPYRSIVFYDQLGCGRSPGPKHKEAYSIESSLDDLEALIKKIGLRRFHLYGQSFGGILAFEYLKRVAERKSSDNFAPKCLSVVLSSSPCDVDQVESVAESLIGKLMADDDDVSTIMERFRMRHQCQGEEKPKAIKDAYDHAGKPGIWRGTDSIKGWKAIMPVEGSQRMPSCMVMRGENDFVSSECVEGWKNVFNHKFVRTKVLHGCSHHGLLENGSMYGDIVDSFFSEYD